MAHRTALGAAFLGLLASLSAQAQDNDTDRGIRWITIAPGIETALPQHAARFDDGNSVRIGTAEGVFLIDPPTNPAVTEGWIERSRALWRTVRYLLSTHRHSAAWNESE